MHRGNLNGEGKKSQTLEIQVKRSYIIFTVAPLDFAARSVAPLCPSAQTLRSSIILVWVLWCHLTFSNTKWKERTSSPSLSRKVDFFRLISSWEISWRNLQGTLHYFEEDITTWLFWNKTIPLEKSKCQIKLMNCLWVRNLGKKGYIPFRQYTNLI